MTAPRTRCGAAFGGSGVQLWRSGSTKTVLQYAFSELIWSSEVSSNPWKSKGVPSQERSSSITYMPRRRSSTGTCLLFTQRPHRRIIVRGLYPRIAPLLSNRDKSHAHRGYLRTCSPDGVRDRVAPRATFRDRPRVIVTLEDVQP